MIVSWNWLKEYVSLDMPVETLANRLMMAGLNLESIDDVEGDLAIDLEVTSNRPDCLCHVGVARETAALFTRDWHLPPAEPVPSGPPARSAVQVEVAEATLCPLYTARLIRGVRVGPSPLWMQRRLKTLGIRPINNVVDCTNYVLMEIGQPLHAFDFARLNGGKIVVRQARSGEKLTAIDQRIYELAPGMCVIADADRPVAIAGVMGGLETEIGPATRDVLIEAAEFLPMSVRATARRLNLHSDSSYRFERGVDRELIDWASRRCCQLILETAGGQLAEGVVSVGTPSRPAPAPVLLRLSEIPQVLGIEIPPAEVSRILSVLGLRPQPGPQPGTLVCAPPSWRRDLTREIDLIEEAARIHGYENIPENAVVPLAISAPTPHDRLVERLARTLVGAGFFEAVTLSFVTAELHALVTPWTAAAPLRVEHSSRQRENILRQSLVPSLLAVRRQNERHGNANAALFEVARVFLAAEPGNPAAEPRVVSAVSGLGFGGLKGVVEGLVDQVNHDLRLETVPVEGAWYAPGRGAELRLNGARLGYLGEVSDEVRRALELHDPASWFELDLGVLEGLAKFSPPYQPVADYPGIDRDLNFVLDEGVSWGELEQVVRGAGGAHLVGVQFASQYRGPQIPAEKKSYVLRLHYRAPNRTLTADEVDAAQKQVVEQCQSKLGAVQR